MTPHSPGHQVCSAPLTITDPGSPYSLMIILIVDPLRITECMYVLSIYSDLCVKIEIVMLTFNFMDYKQASWQYHIFVLLP